MAKQVYRKNSSIHHVGKTLEGKAKQIKLNTKLRIFNSNVKTVLFYGSETWQSTQKTLKRIQTFINKCHAQNLTPEVDRQGIQHDTCKWTKQNEIKKRKWRWIRHTLGKPPETITRQAITRTPPPPQRKRRRGRPWNTRQRDTGKDTNEM